MKNGSNVTAVWMHRPQTHIKGEGKACPCCKMPTASTDGMDRIRKAPVIT